MRRERKKRRRVELSARIARRFKRLYYTAMIWRLETVVISTKNGHALGFREQGYSRLIQHD
jgi:hypothetical protein